MIVALQSSALYIRQAFKKFLSHKRSSLFGLIVIIVIVAVLLSALNIRKALKKFLTL